jgi:hypothetical protein
LPSTVSSTEPLLIAFDCRLPCTPHQTPRIPNNPTTEQSNYLSGRRVMGSERAHVPALQSILREVITGIFTSVPACPIRCGIRETSSSRPRWCWLNPAVRGRWILAVQAQLESLSSFRQPHTCAGARKRGRTSKQCSSNQWSTGSYLPQFSDCSGELRAAFVARPRLP